MTHQRMSPGLSEDVSSPFSWQMLWLIVAPRLKLFFLCLGLCLLATIIYLVRAPRLYQSTATVQVEEHEQRAYRSAELAEESVDDMKGDDVVKTIEQNLQSFDLFVSVAGNPAIAQDPTFLVGYRGTQPASVADIADWLRSNTKVTLRHGTRLIDVTVYHQVPGMAQKLAQAIVDAYAVLSGKTQNATDQASLKFLVTQSDQAKESLQKSENALEIYKDSLLLKDRIDDQQRVIDALKQRYRDKHPQLIQARALLADLMVSFDRDFEKILSDSKTEAAYWEANRAQLAAVPPADRVPVELKLVEARSEVLQEEVDTESALFDNVLKQMRETDVTQDAAVTSIHLVAAPLLPEKPALPRKGLILILGAIGGGLVSLGAIFGAHMLDSSIQSPSEAEGLLGLPVLCAIPRVSRPGSRRPRFPEGSAAPDDAGARPDEVIVSSDAASPAAEAFRSLRAVIGLLGKAEQHRTILFASALPAEGKTFVSCNYALTLAQAGLTTLLIDTDLRRPSVHERFHLDNQVGFVEAVTQDLALDEAVHFQVARNLDVLTAGGKCPNPAELLAGAGFRELLAKALTSYDRIVFDCSPINLVSDSLLIAGHVDTVCLVVRAAVTPRQAPLHAVTLLRRMQKEPSGIVLNALPPHHDRLHLGYKSKDGEAYRQSYS